MTKFRLKRSIKRKRGKLVEVKMLESFESVCAWLEKEGDCDFKKMHEKMKEE